MEMGTWQPPTAPRAMRMNRAENRHSALFDSLDFVLCSRSAACLESRDSSYPGKLDAKMETASAVERTELGSDAYSVATSTQDFDSPERDVFTTTCSPSLSPQLGKDPGISQNTLQFKNPSWISMEQKLRHEYVKIMANAGRIGLAFSPFLPQSEAEYAKLLADIKSVQKARLDRALAPEVKTKDYSMYRFLSVIDPTGADAFKDITLYSTPPGDAVSRLDPSQAASFFHVKASKFKSDTKNENIRVPRNDGVNQHTNNRKEAVLTLLGKSDTVNSNKSDGRLSAARIRRLGDNLTSDDIRAMIRRQLGAGPDTSSSTKFLARRPGATTASVVQEPGETGNKFPRGTFLDRPRASTEAGCTASDQVELEECPLSVATWGRSAGNALAYYSGIRGLQECSENGLGTSPARRPARFVLRQRLDQLAQAASDRHARKSSGDNIQQISMSARKHGEGYLDQSFSGAANIFLPTSPCPSNGAIYFGMTTTPEATVNSQVGCASSRCAPLAAVLLSCDFYGNPVWSSSEVPPSEVVEWPTVADITAEGVLMGRCRSRQLPVPRRNTLDSRKAAAVRLGIYPIELMSRLSEGKTRIPWSMREQVGERWDPHLEVRQWARTGPISRPVEISPLEVHGGLLELLAEIDKQLMED